MSLRTEDGFFFLSALLKMAEDILRGNFLPLPDVDAENLTEFSDSTLASIVVTKYLYADFMRIILPSFEFEGTKYYCQNHLNCLVIMRANT